MTLTEIFTAILAALGAGGSVAGGVWGAYTWWRSQRQAERKDSREATLSLSEAEARFRTDLATRLTAAEARLTSQDRRVWTLSLRLYAFEKCVGLPPHGPCPLRAILPPVADAGDSPPQIITP